MLDITSGSFVLEKSISSVKLICFVIVISRDVDVVLVGTLSLRIASKFFESLRLSSSGLTTETIWLGCRLWKNNSSSSSSSSWSWTSRSGLPFSDLATSSSILATTSSSYVSSVKNRLMFVCKFNRSSIVRRTPTSCWFLLCDGRYFLSNPSRRSFFQSCSSVTSSPSVLRRLVSGSWLMGSILYAKSEAAMRSSVVCLSLVATSKK